MLTALSAKDLVDTGNRFACLSGDAGSPSTVTSYSLWAGVDRWLDAQDPALRLQIGQRSFQTDRFVR